MEASAVTSEFPDKMSPLSFLLRSSWRIYRSHILIFSAIMLIPFAFSIIIYFIYSSKVIFERSGFWFASAATLITLINVLIQLFAYSAMIYFAKDNLALTGSIKSAWRNFLSFLAVTLLASLVSAVGLCLLVIPGIVLITWFSLAAYVLVFEGQRGTAALRRSKELVRGNFFPVLFRLLAAAILVAAVDILIRQVVSLPVTFDGLDFLIGNLIDIFTTPFMVVFGIQIYHDLKRLRGESA
jgi:hypothetical protein